MSPNVLYYQLLLGVAVFLDFLMNLTINLDKLTRCLKSRMSRNSRKRSSQVSTP